MILINIVNHIRDYQTTFKNYAFFSVDMGDPIEYTPVPFWTGSRWISRSGQIIYLDGKYEQYYDTLYRIRDYCTLFRCYSIGNNFVFNDIYNNVLIRIFFYTKHVLFVVV